MTAEVVDARSLFEKRRRLAQISPQLIDVIIAQLHEFQPNGFHEKYLRDILARVMTCKEWPLFKLDEVEYEVFMLQLKRLRAFPRKQRNDALRFSTHHFQRCTDWNPITIAQKKPYKDFVVDETYHAFRYAVGMLTIAWQVYAQVNDEELVLSYNAFKRRYPSVPTPPKKHSPEAR